MEVSAGGRVEVSGGGRRQWGGDVGETWAKVGGGWAAEVGEGGWRRIEVDGGGWRLALPTTQTPDVQPPAARRLQDGRRPPSAQLPFPAVARLATAYPLELDPHAHTGAAPLQVGGRGLWSLDCWAQPG